jgi:streptogramin lyase
LATRYQTTIERLEGRALLSGSLARFPIPAPTADFSDVHSLVSGPDGNLWFVKEVDTANNTFSTSVNRITHAGRISTVDSLRVNSGIYDLTDGPGGSVWFAGYQDNAGDVGEIDPSGEVAKFAVPNSASADRITYGGSGSLWFTATGSNAPFVGRVTAGGLITEYALPKLEGFVTVNACTADRHGNLWVAVSGNDPQSGLGVETIDRITASGQVTEHVLAPIRIPASHGQKAQTETPSVFGMTAGRDGSIWFTEGGYSTTFPRNIVRITRARNYKSFTVFPPGVNGIPDQITPGTGDSLLFSVIDTNWDVPGPLHTIGVISASGDVYFMHFRAKFDNYGDDTGVEPVGRLILEPDRTLWFADGLLGANQIDRLTLPGHHERGVR